MVYGWRMSKYLPYCEFKSIKNVDNFDVNSVSSNSFDGYILEADLEYTNELHNLQNGFPAAPEKLETTYDMLSIYCKKIARKCSIKVGGINKLVPNLIKD